MKKKDIYILEQATSPKPALLEELETETVESVENITHLKSKDARLKLERLMAIQQETTEILKKQGEKLNKIKETSLNLNNNADISQTISLKIDDEKTMIGSYTSVYKKFLRWFTTDTSSKNEIKNIKTKKNISSYDEAEKVKEIDFEPSKNEYIPGENKTEMELSKIYNSLAKINSEAKYQIKIVKDQKETIEDIKKINKDTEKVISETEKRIIK